MKAHGKKIYFAAENIDLLTLLSPDQVENYVRTVLNDKSLSTKNVANCLAVCAKFLNEAFPVTSLVHVPH